MSEGRFWKCRWEANGDGYRAWVASRPKIEASGKTWQDTLDELCGEICSATGDGEPNLRFDPPEPVDGGGDAKWFHPTWSILSIQGSLPLQEAHDQLFTGGVCKVCWMPQGERTDIPLRAAGPADADLCTPWYALSPYSAVMLS